MTSIPLSSPEPSYVSSVLYGLDNLDVFFKIFIQFGEDLKWPSQIIANVALKNTCTLAFKTKANFTPPSQGKSNEQNGKALTRVYRMNKTHVVTTLSLRL